MVVLFKGGVVKVPDNACGPFHAPAPTQEVTLDEVQVNTDVEPMAIEMGLEL